MEKNVASESLEQFINKRKPSIHESAKTIHIDISKKNKKIHENKEDEYAELLKNLK